MKLTAFSRITRHELLLVYGYAKPYIISLGLPVLAYLAGYNLENVSAYFANEKEMLIAFFVGIGAIAFIFQSSVLQESDPNVLTVLAKHKVRDKFVNAAVYQGSLIIIVPVFLFFLAATNWHNRLIGFLELAGTALILQETLSLVSNGNEYRILRETIIIKVHTEQLKNKNAE